MARAVRRARAANTLIALQSRDLFGSGTEYIFAAF